MKGRQTSTQASKKCIEEYFKLYYDLDPIEFLTLAQGCVDSIRINLESALKKVFGRSSPVIPKYFRGKESIWNTRGELPMVIIPNGTIIKWSW